VFDHPMYALLNIAIGGGWAGPPDASTPWPATMLVDWFRYVPNS
jgi:beta-glucanase (GH16 family)